MQKQRIALIEPFLTGSHQKWAEALANHSSHDIDIFGLSGHFWKWRMHGGAITLAKQVIDSGNEYELFLVSDFLDLALFKSLVIHLYPDAEFFLYFHENQITYPWSPTDQDIQLKRDHHYGFINYSSALIADKIFFNSEYHRQVFSQELPAFLSQFPDNHNLLSIETITKKSQTLHLGLDLPVLPAVDKIPNTILWNHRWEYDKNPEDFFQILKAIKAKKIPFQLIILGEHTQTYPPIFDWALDFFQKEIIHFGYVATSADYWEWLQKASVLPVTSNQDFFGISVIEAMHAGVYPILPNRLVYPEHIPAKEKENHLYEQGELLAKLKTKLQSKSKNMPVASWVSQYDWHSCSSKYDLALQPIRNQTKT